MFSLKRGAGTKVTDVNVKPREPVLFCGTAAKEITALRPDTLTFDQQVGCGIIGLVEQSRTDAQTTKLRRSACKQWTCQHVLRVALFVGQLNCGMRVMSSPSPLCRRA